MGNSPLVGNGELPGGEFRAFVSTQLSLVPSLLRNRCVIELKLLSSSTCIHSYGYFIDLINPYSVAFFFCFYFPINSEKITNRLIALSNTAVQNFNSVVGNGELAH